MKRIVIIGASSGIGKELALLYAGKGHQVIITGRRQEHLQQVQASFPENIYTACFDVTGIGIEVHFGQILQKSGGLDLLIYNAGFGNPSDDFILETELATTKVNVMGCVEMVGLAYRYFLQQGVGQIAITSSVAALRGNSRTPAYSASKAFVSNFAEGLNIKARKLNKPIIVTDIRPGFVDTRMAKGNNRFWVASPQKAARQIFRAIEAKKRVAYITKRWWLVAQVMKCLPFSLYRRLA